jgi:hypothetical protein
MTYIESRGSYSSLPVPTAGNVFPNRDGLRLADAGDVWRRLARRCLWRGAGEDALAR